MPAEFWHHDRTIICWPARHEIYGPRFEEAMHAHALLAETIARYEPVTMIVHPPSLDVAREMCVDDVEVVGIPIDDSWSRDTGPICVHDADGEVVGLDFTFNGWGGKFEPFDQDALLARRVSEYLGIRSESVDMVLEGGSVNSDGAGHLVTTEQCLLNPNRNPTMTRDDIAAQLHRCLGAETVIWLPHGLALDHDTDGHVDNVAAFTPTGRLLLQGCDDPREDDNRRMAENERVARALAAECGYEVEVVPVLPFVETQEGRRTVPYLNFYVCNGAVVVPVCGNDADDTMLGIIARNFPGRRVEALRIGEILAVGGGGIHCITQQIPRSRGVDNS